MATGVNIVAITSTSIIIVIIGIEVDSRPRLTSSKHTNQQAIAIQGIQSFKGLFGYFSLYHFPFWALFLLLHKIF